MSEISKQALKVDNSTSFPNNTTGYISPTILRAFNVNMIDSLVEQAGYTANSASWNVSISNLNTYTASFAPSLTQLNAFTASQLTINTGVNGFTQSANSSITQLNTQTASFYAYTSSINQIQSNGVVLGTSTRFNLVGPGTFFSASLVQNVGGTIATLTFTSDNAKVNTSSFNDYTASTAATQSVFSASVATSFSSSNATFTAFSQSQNNFNLSATASIVELLNLSSSLSGGYATQGELDQSASVLQANINQKLFTSSFNTFSASQYVSNSYFATTGSNTFIGNQTITGSINISGSINMVNASDLVTHHIKAQGSNGLELKTSAGTNIVQMGAGGGTQAAFVGAVTANSISASTITGIGNVTNYSTSVDARLNVTATTGSNVFTGSQTITGSVYGNVVSMSIASQTASMDLRVGNFFTLTLVSGSTTHLTATNIRPGQTVNLLVNQPSVGTGSVSYNSTFDFPAGANYVATPITSSKDILSLITFDSSILYATSINNLG